MNNHITIALQVALRHIADSNTTEREADAILEAIVESAASQQEAEAASRTLHHRREARAHQLQLTQLFLRTTRTA